MFRPNVNIDIRLNVKTFRVISGIGAHYRLGSRLTISMRKATARDRTDAYLVQRFYPSGYSS